MPIEKIILVEDDIIVRKSLEQQLRQRRYDVASAGTLAAAQEYLSKDNFDLIFLDVRLPDGEGTDLLKALQAEGVQARIWDYPEQHKLKIYSEAKWWHHPPQIPEAMPGDAYVNANHIFLPIFYGDAPETIGQYVKAFQKIWAHKAALAAM